MSVFDRDKSTDAAPTNESEVGARSFGPQPGTLRVLVVGESLTHELTSRLTSCLPAASITSVPNVLFAMGEAACCEADVVIMPGEQLAGMGESAARCMRELLPEARLVVISQVGTVEEAEAAMRGGFDVSLDEPIDDAALRAAVEGASTDAVTSSSTPDTAATADPQQSTSPTESHPPSPLGDVDLVQTLLQAHEQFHETAVNLLREHSGIAQLEWARTSEQAPADHAQAEVEHAGQLFGVLYAPSSVPTSTLHAWAGWLGHWLALHAQMRELEALSMQDELTGAWNRRYFNRFLERILEQAAEDRSQVTLMVFDIDDFKLYNDRYGHAAGDEILRETARLMRSFVREHDVVARVGGDEFAVIFWDAEQKRQPHSNHPHSVRHAAQRFQKAICAHRFPKLLHEVQGTLTISGGLASYPWDGRTPQELQDRADAMAIQSKRQGKNVITFGPGALRGCEASEGREGSEGPEGIEPDS